MGLWHMLSRVSTEILNQEKFLLVIFLLHHKNFLALKVYEFLELSFFDSFFVQGLIILTPSGVDFTTIPVTESCVSQSLDCI